jgi:hypothetical protein
MDCPCHNHCLVPGNPRERSCRGESPCGCANCICYELLSEAKWEALLKSRVVICPSCKERMEPGDDHHFDPFHVSCHYGE